MRFFTVYRKRQDRFRKRQSAKFFLRFSKKQLFITTCIEKHCTGL